jgi:transposase
MKGRKRHVLVDTMGCLLAVLVLAADVSDRDGGELLLWLYHALYPRLKRIWADSSYEGDLETLFQAQYEIILEIVSKPPEQQGFAPLPRRWVVERSLAWFIQGRRLVRDYERDPAYSEAWLWLSALHRTVKSLAPNPSVAPAYQGRRVA